jgi:hypothetical protein
MDAQAFPPKPQPPPQETRIRMCPYCGSDKVTPAGRVTATGAEVRVRCQCRECSKEFVWLR